ncbi:Fic family protein [Candidatus Margulisiibacteriota bacterium]
MKLRSGQYISQLTGELKYKAFVPSLLPFELKMGDTLQGILSDATLALGRLDGIGDMIPDVDFFILMYVRKEATLSSQVEGTQATFTDALKAEANIQGIEVQNDADEILNYIKAMNYGLERMSSLPLSLRLIKEIHKILLHGVRGKGKTPGQFRKSQNWVGGPSLQTAAYVPPPPEQLMELLDNLEKFLHDISPLPTLVSAGLIHAQFENIHPFLDGNGRIGRLLITFYLCHKGVLKKPLLYLSDFFKQFRQDYYDRLHNIHEKDEVEGWLKYFLTGIEQTANKAVLTVKKIQELRERDIQKIMQLGRTSETALSLLNSLYRTPLVRVKDIEKITSLKNPNALVLTDRMEKLGILKEITGKKRNRVYQYQKYIKIFEEV